MDEQHFAGEMPERGFNAVAQIGDRLAEIAKIRDLGSEPGFAQAGDLLESPVDDRPRHRSLEPSPSRV